MSRVSQHIRTGTSLLAGLLSLAACARAEAPSRFERLEYHHPGLTVDLAAGLWGTPIPWDRNGDGHMDLLLVAASSPSQGVYYFENTGRPDPKTGAPLFKAPVRLGDGRLDVTGSVTSEGLRVLSPGREYPRFLERGLAEDRALPVDFSTIHQTTGRVRGNQWSYVDFDGDGRRDLIVGVGDWTDYGWDAAFDRNGRWTNGPLHGFVYFLRNLGSNESPRYGPAWRLEADHRPVDVYGTPSPVFADFRGTGKLDLICGEFVDGLTFFENVGTRQDPQYAAGRRLLFQGQPLTMPLAMIVVSACDWDHDGHPDLVVSQEDGRTALFRNTGVVTGATWRSNTKESTATVSMPEFSPPVFFRQEAAEIKFGVLSTPVVCDWDGDGRADILTGNTAGEIAFIRNLGGEPRRWAAPVLLEAGGRPIRIVAGYNGSIQGPAESKWGYMNFGVGDWDGDGLPDIVLNTMTGKIVWFRNIGTMAEPRLDLPRPLEVIWKGPTPKPAWNWWDPEPGELVTEWRCTPCLIDLDGDGIEDLVTVDHEGYLAFFRQVVRDGRRVLLPGERIFRMRGPSSFDQYHKATGERDGLLRLNVKSAGASGRRTFCFADWDGDGRLDLLVNSTNVNFLRNVGTRPGEWIFEDQGAVDPKKLAGHSTSPAVANWTGDRWPDLLVGAEDGCFYFLPNPYRPAASARSEP